MQPLESLDRRILVPGEARRECQALDIVDVERTLCARLRKRVVGIAPGASLVGAPAFRSGDVYWATGPALLLLLRSWTSGRPWGARPGPDPCSPSRTRFGCRRRRRSRRSSFRPRSSSFPRGRDLSSRTRRTPRSSLRASRRRRRCFRSRSAWDAAYRRESPGAAFRPCRRSTTATDPYRIDFFVLLVTLNFGPSSVVLPEYLTSIIRESPLPLHGSPEVPMPLDPSGQSSRGLGGGGGVGVGVGRGGHRSTRLFGGDLFFGFLFAAEEERRDKNAAGASMTGLRATWGAPSSIARGDAQAKRRGPYLEKAAPIKE